MSLGLLPECSEPINKQTEPVLRQIHGMQEVKPDKPAKIKLTRNVKNDYSWEINGDNVDEIVHADKKLRKGLKAEQGARPRKLTSSIFLIEFNYNFNFKMR